jgi:(p)ppGpp synthase/HD superfamily hydrolase
MTVPGILDSIEVERRRRMEGRVAPDAHASVLWNRALQGETASRHAARLMAAHAFALGIPYRHEGLSSEIYAAHPLRVAAMALLSGGSGDADTGVVGLLHNVLEVSDVGEEEIGKRFGEPVLTQVRNLTVDRSRQWDADYKRAYYETLLAGSAGARVVKVFDKLDNLYLLGLNSDTDVKTKYMREIVDHVVPMADRDLPAVAPYFRLLVNETIRAERLDLSPI